MIHTVFEGTIGSQLVSLVRVHHFRKELNKSEKLYFCFQQMKAANLSLNSSQMSPIFSEMAEKSMLFPSPSNSLHEEKWVALFLCKEALNTTSFL